ncbi:MAG: hypothetical protein K2P58_14200 [Hyphomonadaceae bacterium]|nr:hypothetical protein [Hyphomonadaceae bacterium]
MGGLIGAGLVILACAAIAVIAGGGLAVAATALGRRANFLDGLEFDGGYNALAHVTDR